MFENIKDPYHASLLHVFLVTFGLFRADNPSVTEMDETGRHGVLVSERGAAASEATAEMRSFRDVKLRDPAAARPGARVPGQCTVVMQTLWPNLIIQQQSNTLAMRQLVPRGPREFELMWTFFGYAGRRRRRCARGGCARRTSWARRASSRSTTARSCGSRSSAPRSTRMPRRSSRWAARDTERADHIVTESAIRAFYAYYREVMGL